jgi:hypothetical protein
VDPSTFFIQTYRYRGEVEKGKRADVYYLEVRKRRGHIFFE